MENFNKGKLRSNSSFKPFLLALLFMSRCSYCWSYYESVNITMIHTLVSTSWPKNSHLINTKKH